MDFILSKVLWWFISLDNLFAAGLIGAALLLLSPWRKWGARLTILTAAVATFFAVVPVGDIAIRALENRFPIPQILPEKVDGIIALGGIVDQFLSENRGQVSIGNGVERLTEMVRLANRYPEAKVFFTGGSGNLFRQDLKESTVVRQLLDELGFDSGRVVFEEQSRNTVENAEFTKALVNPQDGQTWLLVTSAFHMPRSVGCFRAADFDVIPYPVDYITKNEPFALQFTVINGVSRANAALHEWLGLLSYYLMGRTDALFPAPSS